MVPERQKGGTGSELGCFLRACRARVSPGDTGLAVSTGPRRTPGLRREELAALAGVSIDYYARLERGKETRPSPAVVDALARALRLAADEYEHLRDLAAHARAAPDPSTVRSQTVGRGIVLLLESLRPSPAYVLSRTLDVLASNLAGLRLLAGMEQWPDSRRNIARYVFLHPEARTLLADWDEQIRSYAGYLRALAGTDPDLPGLARLVDELLIASEEFARYWDHYELTMYSQGRKTFHHPVIGELALGYQSLRLDGTPGHRLIHFYAEPGSPDHDAVLLLDKAAVDLDDRLRCQTGAHGE